MKKLGIFYDIHRVGWVPQKYTIPEKNNSLNHPVAILKSHDSNFLDEPNSGPNYAEKQPHRK